MQSFLTRDQAGASGARKLFGSESNYVESRFGILVPDRIIVEWYVNRKSKAKPTLARAARTTYTYGAYKQFRVATDERLAAPAGR